MPGSSTSSDDYSIPPSLDALASLLESREHLLAAATGDKQLAQRAVDATKGIFDLAVALEPSSHPHLHPFLVSILQPPAISLRSSAKAVDEEGEDVEPAEVLPYTPLSVLTTEGMNAEQVWQQLELRAEGICRVAKEVGSGEEVDEDASGMGWEEESGSEDEEGIEMDEEDLEDMSVEDWKRMMAEEGYEDGMSDSEGSEGSDLGSEDELEMGSEDEDKEGDDDEEEQDEEDEEGDEDDVDMDAASDDEEPAAGPSKPRKSKKAQHPTLDDQFFSIDDFNRMTEEQEAGRVTSGALGGDEDGEAELDDIGAMFLQEGDDDDADLMYSDFFAPPEQAAPAPSDHKKRTKKGKSARFADEEEEEDDKFVSAFPDEDEDETRDVMSRVKGDLFDDSDDEGGEEVLSTHEKRQRALAEQIAELESQAIGPKDWTLLGEASARARPENSLLEENLDFEQVAKSVPVITEESVQTLEDLIKRRILDNHFNDVETVRAYDPTPFLPSRFFELQDTQSTKSLAQIYEDEYQTAASGGKATDARDDKLKKEHDEIDRLWDEVSYKLDALSSLNFVPKAPKAQITTIDNIATTSMETALPSSNAAETMLAPHELFAGPSASELTARSEQTPEEAKRARGKARKSKKAERARIATTASIYGTKRKSVKEQKDEAMAQLVKGGKGVTVVGKGGSEDAKRKRREMGEQDAKRLKL